MLSRGFRATLHRKSLLKTLLTERYENRAFRMKSHIIVLTHIIIISIEEKDFMREIQGCSKLGYS
jgi:hypothetical protein